MWGDAMKCNISKLKTFSHQQVPGSQAELGTSKMSPLQGEGNPAPYSRGPRSEQERTGGNCNQCRSLAFILGFYPQV